MSKKNKRKYHQHSSSPSATISATPAAAGSHHSAPVSGDSGHREEYRVIRHDLWKVLGLNLFFLAAILVIYYTNQNSQYLERWFSHFVK
jgi:hypothetical protein